MDTTRGLSSHCRHCRFYTPEGRRGGHCGQLGVNVSGSWQSCSLSMAPFAPSWEAAELFPEPQRSRPVVEIQRTILSTGLVPVGAHLGTHA
jgi:hypothetical protein